MSPGSGRSTFGLARLQGEVRSPYDEAVWRWRLRPPPSLGDTDPVMHDDPHETFWEIAFEFLGRDDVEEGTMFGFGCLRASGQL